MEKIFHIFCEQIFILCFFCKGGPVFTEIKEDNPTPDDKKQYQLHAITGQGYDHKKEYYSVTTYVGDKRERILGMIS